MDTMELRSVQLATLQSFDAFCQENGLRYQLTYGTLLGAIRHSGYIPWDDDIDVMMLRGDYERFLTTFRSAEYVLRAPGLDSGWPLPFAKLWDVRTVVYEASDLPLRAGVGIDIFPVDGLPTTTLMRRIQHLFEKLAQWVEVVVSVRVRADHTLFMRTTLRYVKPAFNVVGAARLARFRDRLARIWSSPAPTLQGILVGSYLWSVPTETLSNDVFKGFEHLQVPVPQGWDHVLTTMYGDYMTLPSASQQVTHHSYEAVWVD